MGNEQEFVEQQLQNFGKRLRAVRKRKGYSSFEKFAYLHDMNRAQFGRYENGANIGLATLIKILKALDISLKDFFSEGFEE